MIFNEADLQKFSVFTFELILYNNFSRGQHRAAQLSYDKLTSTHQVCLVSVCSCCPDPNQQTNNRKYESSALQGSGTPPETSLVDTH